MGSRTTSQAIASKPRGFADGKLVRTFRPQSSGSLLVGKATNVTGINVRKHGRKLKSLRGILNRELNAKGRPSLCLTI